MHFSLSQCDEYLLQVRGSTNNFMCMPDMNPTQLYCKVKKSRALHSCCEGTLHQTTSLIRLQYKNLGVVLSTGDRLCAVPGVPYSVEPAIFVCALVGVTSKKVSLCLDQVGWQTCTPDAVKITQRGCHARCAQTYRHTQHISTAGVEAILCKEHASGSGCTPYIATLHNFSKYRTA